MTFTIVRVYQVHVLDKPVQKNLKWLEVVEYCQAGDSKFVPSPGCWMQFEQVCEKVQDSRVRVPEMDPSVYASLFEQGGLLLHPAND